MPTEKNGAPNEEIALLSTKEWKLTSMRCKTKNPQSDDPEFHHTRDDVLLLFSLHPKRKTTAGNSLKNGDRMACWPDFHAFGRSFA